MKGESEGKKYTSQLSGKVDQDPQQKCLGWFYCSFAGFCMCLCVYMWECGVHMRVNTLPALLEKCEVAVIARVFDRECGCLKGFDQWCLCVCVCEMREMGGSGCLCLLSLCLVHFYKWAQQI